MLRAQIEEVNGSIVLVLPPIVVERLHLSPGSQIDLEVKEGILSLSRPTHRGRYRIEDMIAASDPRAFEQTEEDREFLNSPAVGRELI